jgi:nucleoside-diphosphate-sugar epimerase
MHALLAHDVFVTGGTGYMGQQLVPALLQRGHRVRVLTRASSVSRVPAGAEAVIGEALDATSFVSALRPTDTIVHLVGTPHPNPRKAAEFTRVDLASIRATVQAAQLRRTPHVVYVSVAHPAPMMHDYIAARTAGEQSIRDAALTATVLRPWYVLGPGHWWPLVLTPLYAIGARIPAFRDGATRLGLVTLKQMVRALVTAVEQPPAQGTVSVMDVPTIRRQKWLS